MRWPWWLRIWPSKPFCGKFNQTFEGYLGALGQPEPPLSAEGPLGSPGKPELADHVGPQKGYVTRLPDGQLQVFPIEYNARISSVEYLAICSQCYMQSAIRAPGPDGELNYSRSPDVFYKRYRSRPYAEFPLNARYRDGRFRKTGFIVESFLRSSYFRKGGATCVSCHDHHHDDAGSNLTSMLFRSEPHRMCTQCHAEFNNAANLQQHTRHPVNSEGSEWGLLSYARIMMSQARTHRIDDIPSARMSEQFGPQQSPSACVLCHSDKSMAWLDQQLEAR